MTQWHDMLKKIEREFKDHPTSYLSQPTISKTIHPRIKSLAQKYYDALGLNALGMGDARHADPHVLVNGHSLTNLQQLWYLHNIEARLCPIKDLGEVCEIGPGYGNLYRLLRLKDYVGSFKSVDFPLMHRIQDDWLSHVFKDTSPVAFKLIDESYRPSAANSLMVATFSMNEMPLEDREHVIDSLHHDFFFFHYNRSFDGIDNLEWFDKLAERLEPTYEIEKWKCPIHFSGTYMIGKKR